MPRRMLFLTVAAALTFFLIVGGRITGSAFTTPMQQQACTTTVEISSAFGAASGSGSYPCGSSVTFDVSPSIVTSGDVRYVFTGWSCSGSGCYSGSTNPSSLITGGNNSIIMETALWMTEYLLTISSSPSSAGSTNPTGSFWESAGAVVSVAPQATESSWFFAYWSLDSEENAGSSPSYTVAMDSPHLLRANFVKLNVTTQLLNATSSNGLVLRNLDGTFYRGDAFQISYGIAVVNGSLPSNIVPIIKYSFSTGDLTEVSNETGRAEFLILSTAPYAVEEVTASGYLQNEVDDVIIQSPSSSSQPFAVVQYHPVFSYITYMEYNNLSASTYARPFVTLVRYDGNVPGYSYAGDANTDPFNAYNSTMERAFLNNFTFSVEGWNVSTNQTNPASSLEVVSYNAHNNLNVRVEMLNKSYPNVITWNQRVWKFYFLANLPSIHDYISNDGIIYFNITESAWYLQGAAHYSEFNTSYLYEPVFYNGYLVFKSSAPANGFNVSIVAHNPDPLNAYLIQEVEGIFGNDSQVIGSFEQDLYPAYSTTMVLKPFFENSTEEVFLVNQTNMMTPQYLDAPYFTISVHGLSGITTYVYNQSAISNLGQPVTSYQNGQAYENITYIVSDEYSLFEMNDFSPPSPFPYFTGYFLAQSNGYYVIAQPTSFSFNSSASYLVRTYAYAEAPFFITQEPGNLTQDYTMLYGQNVTVDSDFAGGGITSLVVSSEGNGSIFYDATISIDGGGGVTQLLVMSDSGQVLYNESITSNDPMIASFSPPEFIGAYTFEFPVYSNGTISINMNGTWGSIDRIVDVSVASNYGEPAPSGITSQIMDIVWYLFVPVLLLFWFAVAWLKLRRGNREESSAPTPY
ncbi:MAG: hypothetical protein ABSE82_14505 [Nitrososphaerales archaeon]